MDFYWIHIKMSMGPYYYGIMRVFDRTKHVLVGDIITTDGSQVISGYYSVKYEAVVAEAKGNDWVTLNYLDASNTDKTELIEVLTMIEGDDE